MSGLLARCVIITCRMCGKAKPPGTSEQALSRCSLQRSLGSLGRRKDYPPRYPKGVHGNVYRMNTIFARVVILAGLAMAIIGLVIEIVSPT
jgi:hypothetical protein